MTLNLRRLLGLCVLSGLTLTTPALADTIFEVEGARANARAGRPLSGEEGELLNRWGALSGSPGWRHRYPEEPGFYDFYYDEPRQLRRRSYRPLR